MCKFFNGIKDYGGLTAVIFFLIILYACERNSELPEGLVAQVNDRYFVKEQLKYRVPPDLDADMALALKKDLILKWVESEVLYQAAQKADIVLDEKENFLLAEYEKSLVIQIYLRQKLNSNYKISQREIEDYYREHSGEFIRSQDEVHIIHLFLEQRDNAIFSEIARSNDLMKLIKKYFFDEKLNRERPNDDLGYVRVSQLPEEIRRTLRYMKTGAISSPIKTDQGYHFIQLLDRQDAGSQKDIDLVKNEIILRLKRERRQMELERLQNELRKDAQIQTYFSKIQE